MNAWNMPIALLPPPTQANKRIRQTAFALQDFRASFFADHAMKIAHHHRIRMRAQRRAEQIIRRVNIRHPVAHGFADRVFQRAAAVGHADDFRAQQAHAKDVQPLPPHVLFAHVDGAVEAEQRAHRRRGDSMLARAGFRDDPLLAHAPREQRLSKTVVDFVRAGVQQIFALQINLRAAQLFGQTLGEIQRRWTAGVVFQQIGELGLKRRILRSR